MRKVGFVLGALVLLAIALGPAFAAAAQPFSDVPRDHWAYNAIERLSQLGVIEGYPDGTYKGKRMMTRYEFAVAIARIMDRVEQLQGQPGPQGPPGPAGAAGTGGGAGLTAEQQALLDRLAREFAPELQSLRSDLDALTRRVEDLEANRPKPPVVTFSGGFGWRTGAYGTKLKLQENDDDGIETTGYPAIDFRTGFFNTAFGTITVPGTGLIIPISDALKDSFKANDFMAMRGHLDANINLGGNATGLISLLWSPNSSILSPGRTTFGEFGPTAVSPSALSGNGILDGVQVDQAWFKTGTKFLTPIDLTIGKQYLRRGQGLLFDNDQMAIPGLRADFGAGGFRVGGFYAMLDPNAFFGANSPMPVGLDQNGHAIGMYRPMLAGDLYTRQLGMYGGGSAGQDTYGLVTADFDIVPGWRVGGNWLASGFGREEGWSASLSGSLFGLDLYGEFAQLLKWGNGEDFADLNGNDRQDPGETSLSDSDSAWLAGLRWGNSWLNLTGEYGEVDAGYAFTPALSGWDPIGGGARFFNLPLSALHPRAEIDPYDINWVDRRLFLDATNIARGWHVGLNLPTVLGPKTPISFSYASGDAYSPAYLGWLFTGGSHRAVAMAAPEKWRDADPVWWVKVAHQMNEAVSASLLYGRREVDNVLSPGTQVVAPGGVTASTDAVQVIRAELSVQF